MSDTSSSSSSLGKLSQVANIVSGFSPVASIASSVLGGIFGRSAENRQFENQVKMWNMQNEYNKPINQMKRLEEAGLNPNLMYGQGNTGNASSMSAPNAYAGSYVNPKDAVLSALSALSAVADIKIKQAQAKNLEAQSSSTELKTSWYPRIQLAGLNRTEASTRQTEENTRFLQSKRAAQDWLNDFNDKTVVQQRNILEWRASKMYFDAKYRERELDFINHRWERISYEDRLQELRIAQQAAQIALSEAHITLTYAQARNAGLIGDQLAREGAFNDFLGSRGLFPKGVPQPEQQARATLIHILNNNLNGSSLHLSAQGESNVLAGIQSMDFLIDKVMKFVGKGLGNIGKGPTNYRKDFFDGQGTYTGSQYFNYTK